MIYLSFTRGGQAYMAVTKAIVQKEVVGGSLHNTARKLLVENYKPAGNLFNIKFTQNKKVSGGAVKRNDNIRFIM